MAKRLRAGDAGALEPLRALFCAGAGAEAASDGCISSYQLLTSGLAESLLEWLSSGEDGRIEGKVIKPVDEGVLIHGLFLEGAQWHRNDKRFEEQTAKDFFFPFPIIHVSAETTNKE